MTKQEIEVLLTVDLPPYTVGKQPFIPLINIGRKWTKDDQRHSEGFLHPGRRLPFGAPLRT